MSWKKHFKIVNPLGNASPMGNGASEGNFGFKNYQSPLPDVYTGHPNRIERYNQYELMDLDPEINASLDIISEFCTQKSDENNTPFEITFNDTPSQTESTIINEQLKNWVSLNDMNRRIMKMMRNTIKYGDQIFVRDPETFELFWVDMAKVTKIVVNESRGKEIETYFIKDLSANFENMTLTSQGPSDIYTRSPMTGSGTGAYNIPNVGHNSGSRFQNQVNEQAIDAKHVVHLSLTEGLDVNWPFGTSILENIFKVFKQKELIEDALLIYRIQRAPERLAFYIDTGSMPAHLAHQYVERVKNEMHQRRLPTKSGGGQNVMDATYNPMSINENFFFSQTADGRGSKVESIAGGMNLGEIDDLKYFNNKLLRGLRIPSSYLPSGNDDGSQQYTDGKVTTALIQENRFNEYCMRLQSNVDATLDHEFKMFLQFRGIQIDNSLFELKLCPPLNFAAYRSIDLDNASIATFSGISAVPFISNRFALKKYLRWSESEIKENEKLWLEENGDEPAPSAAGSDLRNVGVTPGGITSDLDNIDSIGDMDMGGMEMPDGGGSPDAAMDDGGAGAAPAAAPPGGGPALPGLTQ